MPLQNICEYCLLKIRLILDNLEKRIINQWHLYNMQTNLHNPNDTDDKQPPQEQPHEYNCDCRECQIKFGSLPLLVQVIECQEKSAEASNTMGSTSLSSEKATTNNKVNTSSGSAIDLPEPSTSSAHSSNTRKSMTCPHCSKSFTHRGDFNKHIRTHTGEQPYKCEICNKRFAHTSNLNRHLKVHSGDRPYVCTVCNKNFNRKDKLDLHKKTKRCKKFSEKQM